jgi:hypothetical protein
MPATQATSHAAAALNRPAPARRLPAGGPRARHAARASSEQGTGAAPGWKARAVDRIARDRERVRRLRAEAKEVAEEEREYARGIARDLLEAFAEAQGAIREAVSDAREVEREARDACSGNPGEKKK